MSSSLIGGSAGRYPDRMSLARQSSGCAVISANPSNIPMKRRNTGSAKPNRTSLKRKSLGNVSLSSVDGSCGLSGKAETTYKLIKAHIAAGVDEDAIEEDLIEEDLHAPQRKASWLKCRIARRFSGKKCSAINAPSI
jgi:hypothetical protein